jgi:Fe-S oxidoreductase
MPRLRNRSFCCGAGGGRAWTKGKSDNAITKNRTGEVIATGAEVICTACSYCLTALSEDLLAQEHKNDIRVMDIAEILEMSLPEDEK